MLLEIEHRELPKGHTFTYKRLKYTVVESFWDEGKLLYVFKYFGVSQQWWHYEVWSAFEYEIKVAQKRELSQLRGHEFGSGKIEKEDRQ